MKPNPFCKKLLLMAMLFLSMVSCASTKATTEEKAQRATAHYQLGVSYLSDNNIQPAFVEFHKALELDPNNKEVLNAIGVVYLLKLEDYPRAIEYLQKALKVDNNYSEAINNLGVAYEKSGRYSDAVEAFRSAATNPFYRSAERALNNLGRVYYRTKRYNDAADSFKEAIKRSPDFPMPYYGLALCYNALARYGDAALALKKAIDTDPSYRGDREKALREMRERKLVVKGEEEKDLEDLLEIMNY